MPVPTTLPSLEDLALIEDTTARYNRSIHTGDRDEFLAVFTDDAVWDSPLEGKLTGHAELGPWFDGYSASASDFHGGQHWVTNRVFDEVSDDAVRTWTTWFFLAPGGGTPHIPVMGEYHDELVRQDGRWRIRHRRIVITGQGT
jgi:ketosteroid isomerase-like protein